MCVKIVDFKERVSQDGETFLALIVMSGVEIIQSQNGNMYATSKRASIPCTFTADEAKSLIGTELPGEIVKIQCFDYEYTHPKTGEVMVLNHRYVYAPEEEKAEANPFEFVDGIAVGNAAIEFAH